MKSEMSLNPTYGIDGMDGGSPILFHPNGTVKSSRQALEGFLSQLFLDVLSLLICCFSWCVDRILFVEKEQGGLVLF
jgi:hypothetical protein